SRWPGSSNERTSLRVAANSAGSTTATANRYRPPRHDSSANACNVTEARYRWAPTLPGHPVDNLWTYSTARRPSRTVLAGAGRGGCRVRAAPAGLRHRGLPRPGRVLPGGWWSPSGSPRRRALHGPAAAQPARPLHLSRKLSRNRRPAGRHHGYARLMAIVLGLPVLVDRSGPEHRITDLSEIGRA